jgi:hypothetical protein
VIYVRFAAADCLLCQSREECTQARYLALQSARERQCTEAFKETYAIRAGIESTISQAVRVSDLATGTLLWVAKNSPPARDYGHCDQCQTDRLLARRAVAVSYPGLSFCRTCHETKQASGVKQPDEFANAVKVDSIAGDTQHISMNVSDTT